MRAREKAASSCGTRRKSRTSGSPTGSSLPVINAVFHRVNYSETDQMGFVYHANYLIWMDMARTEHLRERGMSYRDMERQGTYLTVTDVHVRSRQPARYDDLIRVRCWVRDLASR